MERHSARPEQAGQQLKRRCDRLKRKSTSIDSAKQCTDEELMILPANMKAGVLLVQAVAIGSSLPRVEEKEEAAEHLQDHDLPVRRPPRIPQAGERT